MATTIEAPTTNGGAGQALAGAAHPSDEIFPYPTNANP